MQHTQTGCCLIQVPSKWNTLNMAVDDAYTKSLLHFNGTDTSTTFTDESGKTWTPHGDAQLDTAAKKFGTASGLFDGTGDYIDTPDSDDFTLGSGDWTFDCWIRNTNATPHKYIFGQSDNASTGSSCSIRSTVLASTNVLMTIVTYGTTEVTVTSTTAITVDGLFHHVAIVRYGNTITQYIDGVPNGTGDVTGRTINNSASKFTIGRPGEYNNYFWFGWIDEFRFSAGIARWTSNFSASLPSAEYGPTTGISKVSGVAYASIKKVSGVAIASVKKVAGLT